MFHLQQKKSGSTSSAKNSTTSAKTSGAAASSKKSSSAKNSGTPSKKSSTNSAKNSTSNSAHKASNAPVASNKPQSSAIDLNKELEENSTNWVKICICSTVVVAILICIICIFCRKKKGKVGYFYDDSGNPDEKAKVVYIK